MKETVGQRLRRLRKDKKLTQAELAKKAGVGQSAIGNIEAGTRGYGISVVAIAKALDTSPDYLQMERYPRADDGPGTDPQQTSERNGTATLSEALTALEMALGHVDEPAIAMIQIQIGELLRGKQAVEHTEGVIRALLVQKKRA